MNIWLWILAQLVALVAIAYFYYQKKFRFWSDRGVSGPQPVPVFGNLWSYIRTGQLVVERRWLQRYGKVYGVYQGAKPVLSVVDAELVKQVLVKDFGSFVNRDLPRFEHDIWSANLFNAEDEGWRRIRAITSPSFTTGKLRGMHSMMGQCVDRLEQYFQTVIEKRSGRMNAKEAVTGFTMDVIASTSFATQTNANGVDRETDVFFQNGVNLISPNPLRLACFLMLPKWINKLMGTQLGFRLENFNFFTKLSRAIIHQRRREMANNQAGGNKAGKRNDLVQLMMDAFVYESEGQETDYDRLTATDGHESEEEKQPKEPAKSGSVQRRLTENEIIAQCILFIVAGFETTANTLANALFYLATNPEIQDRLRAEVNTALSGVTEHTDAYLETVNTAIPYLEAVIKETLRLRPPVPRLQRRVGVDGYKLNGISLPKDTAVELVTFAIHHCPEYYPEPDRFDPDRFMPENKHKLVPYTYLPFGAGPRNCIGMRFAYQEIRLTLARLLPKFRFVRTEQTPAALEYTKLALISVRNVPLKVERV